MDTPPTSDAYNEYVKVFTEQYIPLLRKYEELHRQESTLPSDEEQAFEAALGNLDRLYHSLSLHEKSLTDWWGVRANAQDYISMYDKAVEKLMTDQHSPDELREVFQTFLEETGWLVAVIKADYVNRPSPPLGWTYDKEPCDCKKTETTSE